MKMPWIIGSHFMMHFILREFTLVRVPPLTIDRRASSDLGRKLEIKLRFELGHHESLQ